MHIADYQTPTTKSRVTQVDVDKEFAADEARIAVLIRTVSNASVFLGDTEFATFIGSGNLELPHLYVGPFRIEGTAVVTEILVHNHS